MYPLPPMVNLNPLEKRPYTLFYQQSSNIYLNSTNQTIYFRFTIFKSLCLNKHEVSSEYIFEMAAEHTVCILKTTKSPESSPEELL